MIIYLISPGKRQYKANLHAHSTLSDGKLRPEQLKEIYKDHDYSILAITDHEHPYDHSALSDPDFLMLTGYEAYIRPDKANRYDKFAPEMHINLLAKEPHNKRHIGFTPIHTRYLSEEEKLSADKAGPKEDRRYTVGYVNRFVQSARENGYLVMYNHPYWSLEEYETILSYRGIDSLEICNYTSFLSNRLEHNGQIYDAMLRHGMRVFAHAADDNHNFFPIGDPMCDSFGAATMIYADSLSYEDVISALEQGNFYATMGPEIYELSFADGIAHIHTSPVDAIIMYDGSKEPKVFPAPAGGKIAEAIVRIPEEAPYIRFSAINDGYKFADTRGYFREEFEI